jgi:hypothetical protein
MMVLGLSAPLGELLSSFSEINNTDLDLEPGQEHENGTKSDKVQSSTTTSKNLQNGIFSRTENSSLKNTDLSYKTAQRSRTINGSKNYVRNTIARDTAIMLEKKEKIEKYEKYENSCSISRRNSDQSFR